MKLVLWDIDHTLIATRGVGRELFGKAFEEVTGTVMSEQAIVDGIAKGSTWCVIGMTWASDGGFELELTQAESDSRLSSCAQREASALPCQTVTLCALSTSGGMTSCATRPRRNVTSWGESGE